MPLMIILLLFLQIKYALDEKNPEHASGNHHTYVLELKRAYSIIHRFLVHYQILHFFNIAIVIVDFS